MDVDEEQSRGVRGLLRRIRSSRSFSKLQALTPGHIDDEVARIALVDHTLSSLPTSSKFGRRSVYRDTSPERVNDSSARADGPSFESPVKPTKSAESPAVTFHATNFEETFQVQLNEEEAWTNAVPRHQAILAALYLDIENEHLLVRWKGEAFRFLTNGRNIVSKAGHEMLKHGNGRVLLDLAGHPGFAKTSLYDYPGIHCHVTSPSPTEHESTDDISMDVVPDLTNLPYPDNTFDVVTARKLYFYLKEDEWIRCFAEIRRVMKPGGVVDILVSDAVPLNAGEEVSLAAKEFCETLVRKNYDPCPSKRIISSLMTTGYEDIRRCWLAMSVNVGNEKMAIISGIIINHIYGAWFDERGDWPDGQRWADHMLRNAHQALDTKVAMPWMMCTARKPILEDEAVEEDGEATLSPELAEIVGMFLPGP